MQVLLGIWLIKFVDEPQQSHNYIHHLSYVPWLVPGIFLGPIQNNREINGLYLSLFVYYIYM
jgi:hypothetical protein